MEIQRRTPHLHWVDALRVLVVGGIAVFHGCLVFSGRPWLVNNAQPDVVMAAFDAFTFQWGLALLFALSGMATWFALRRHSPADLVGLRWRTLGLPLVLGVAILSPLQALVATHQPLDAAHYAAWVGSIHLTAQHLSSMAGTVYHLWFLVFLLLISTVCVPVLAWLRTPAGVRVIDLVAAHAGGRFGFLLLAAPLVLVAAAVMPAFPAFEDWGDLAKEAVVFVLGALIVSDPRLSDGLKRQGWSSLWVGAAASIAIGLVTLVSPDLLARPGYSLQRIAAFGLTGLNTWSWVTFFMAFGARVLNGASAWPRRLSELSMPFYVLHHPVLVVTATMVVTLPIGPWPKLVLVLLPTYAVTGALCALIERRSALRALFGMQQHPAGLRLQT